MNHDSDQEILDDVDITILEMDKRDRIINTMDNLYTDIICRFQSGTIQIYHPHVIPFLSRTDFINWIINNNETVAKIINNSCT